MVAVAPLMVVEPLAEMEEAAVEPLVEMKAIAFAPLREARVADRAAGGDGGGGGRAAGEATAARVPKRRLGQLHR